MDRGLPDEKTYSLDLLRSELGRATAELKVDLFKEFVSKTDMRDVLDRMNVHEKLDDGRFREIGNKLDLLLMEKAERQGAEQIKTKFTDSKRFALTVLLTAFGLLIAALTALATILWLQHG